MPERAPSTWAAWSHRGQVRPAFQLLPTAHHTPCATESAATTGWHLALDERANERLMPLPGPIVRVGRAPHCDLCIDHPTVANDHAVLTVRRASLALFTIDAGGRTFLNGRRVQDRAQLTDYDIVLFGDAMVVVRHIDAPTAHRSHPMSPSTVL